MSMSYKKAGVDIAAGREAVELIKETASSTFSPAVLTGLGSFGSFFDLSEAASSWEHPVLVQSIDGTGTKPVLAGAYGDFSRIGKDLVSACCNDIAVHGARPLTLLDYIANDRLDPRRVAEIVSSIAEGCRACGVSLVGGETAEMPGVYLPGEHDLVGVVTGVAEKDRIINGKGITEGQAVLGVSSSGLHTNGYSLARKIIDTCSADLFSPFQLADGRRSEQPLGELLLKEHINYTSGILQLLDLGYRITGMAHITGGGLIENVPRILPEGLDARIYPEVLEAPLIFSYLIEAGNLSSPEAYRTFNMGIGLIIVCPRKDSEELMQKAEEVFHVPCREVGEITAGNGSVHIHKADGEVLP